MRVQVRNRRSYQASPAHEVSTIAWMVTFSDLLTLLLTFFVLRISMGVIDAEAMYEFMHQERRTVASRAEAINRDLVDRLTLLLGEPVPEGASNVLRFPNEIALETRDDSSKLALGGGTFHSGSRELSEEAAKAVKLISRAVFNKDVEIQIAGHTDNVPINSAEFPSNWELSAARAITVANLMIEVGVAAQRISAVGYGDTIPLDSNETPEGRHKNRRVEIIIKPTDSAD